MEQRLITPENGYQGLEQWFMDKGLETVMLVCGSSAGRYAVYRHLEDSRNRLGLRIVRFSEFEPNPRYESVVKGVERYRAGGCQGIVAIGGGSAMDVAKCIKLYSTLPGDGEGGSWLTAACAANEIPFLAVPTTAGTGSEATRYAVIYYDGKKQSVTHDSLLPDAVVMDPAALTELPLYQKKATMCDALCHALESFWSVNSTRESKEYSRKAIELVLANRDGYLANTQEGRTGMLLAANTAGKAINITQTTAGHAMCYRITGLFGAAHGHAAMLCDRVLFRWMVDHTEACVDPRGEAYLRRTLDELGAAMGCADAHTGSAGFAAFFEELGLEVPAASEEQFAELKNGVNPVRLKNHPVALDAETIDSLYHEILRGKA